MRRITVSEAAALQGFPPDFEFCGSRCERYRQIGNSVPPPFAEAIARCVVRQLERNGRGGTGGKKGALAKGNRN